MRIIDFVKRNRLIIYLLPVIAGIVSLPLIADGVPIGMDAQSFDKLLLVLINFLTAVVAYACFCGMYEEKEAGKVVGIVGSMLYTWCPYRVSDLYIGADLGESLAWTFFPVILLGMILLYTIPREEKQYKRIWVILTLGFSLLLVSSVTFFCVGAGMMLILLFVMGRESLHKETVLCVVKTAFVTGLLNVWNLIPLARRLMDASVVGPMIPANFRMRGMYLMQYLNLFPAAGSELDFLKSGAVNARTMGVGAAVLLLVFLYLWCLFVRKFEDKLGAKILLATLLLVVLSCNFFPWDLLQNKNMLFSVILALLQSPAKWGVAACAGLIWIACRMLEKLSKGNEEKLYWSILVVTVVISFGATQYMTCSILGEVGAIW